MRAPSDVDPEPKSGFDPETDLVAALERRFAAGTPDAAFADALERRIVARRRELAGVRASAAEPWWIRVARRLSRALRRLPVDAPRPPDVARPMDSTREANAGRPLGASRPLVGSPLRLRFAAGAVLLAMVALGFGAGTGRLPAAGDAVRTIVDRIRSVLPLVPSTPDGDAGLLPPTESTPLYVVPGEGILPLAPDDLVQARSPQVFHTDVVSWTLSSLWSNDDGTSLVLEADVTGAIGAYRSTYPADADREVVLMLRLGASYSEQEAMPRSAEDGRKLVEWGVGTYPRALLFETLPSTLRTIEMTIVVTTDPYALRHPDAEYSRGKQARTVEATVTVPLASPGRGDLARAIPCDVRAEAGGVTVRASAVAFTPDATYVRLDGDADPLAGTLELRADGHEIETVADLAAVVTLRDDTGRSFAPLAIPGGTRAARRGVKFGVGDPLNLLFPPLAGDARAVSLTVTSVVAANDDHLGTSWIGTDDAVATVRVPLAGADSLSSSSAFDLHRRGQLMTHPDAVLLNRALSIQGGDLRIVSVVPARHDDHKTNFLVYFAPGPERDGRQLHGMWSGHVSRVGLGDWLKVGGLRDLGRRYCSEDGGGQWWPLDREHPAMQNIYVDIADERVSRDDGTVELCFSRPVFAVRGPWQLALPLPAGDRG